MITSEAPRTCSVASLLRPVATAGTEAAEAALSSRLRAAQPPDETLAAVCILLISAQTRTQGCRMANCTTNYCTRAGIVDGTASTVAPVHFDSEKPMVTTRRTLLRLWPSAESLSCQRIDL
eukprot:scpid59408/ scgid30106/ 